MTPILQLKYIFVIVLGYKMNRISNFLRHFFFKDFWTAKIRQGQTFCRYSGDFLKVNHFRRCLALYVRDPRVGNYRVSPALLREFRAGIIINQSNHIINTYSHSRTRDVCAGSQAPIILPVYTREANAGPRRNAFIQSNPLKGTAVSAWVFEPIVWLPARWAKI